MRWLLAVAYLLSWQPFPSLAQAPYAGSLFDAHLHMIAQREMPPEHFVSFVREAGLSGAFLFGLPNPPPDFIYPFVHVPINDSRQLQLNEEGLRFLEEQLEGGIVRGIAEIPLRHPLGFSFPADGPIPTRICELAARRGVPVIVHVEHEYSVELGRALARSRKTVIIWAHGGDGPPALLRSMLKKHSNLYADISCRNPLFKRRATLEEQSLTEDASCSARTSAESRDAIGSSRRSLRTTGLSSGSSHRRPQKGSRTSTQRASCAATLIPP